jgi:hypothetical protein
MMKRTVLRLFLYLLLFCTLYGQDIGKDSFREWDSRQVETLLSDSPWAGTVNYPAQERGDNRLSKDGERQFFDRFTIRFFSALPIRQGYVRKFQILNHYDGMSMEEQKVFDRKFHSALKNYSDLVVINLDSGSDNPDTRLEFQRQLKQVGLDQLKRSTYLMTDRFGRVEIIDYFPPAPDGTGAKFVFPRILDGTEILSAEDRQVRFEVWVPGTSHQIRHSWSISDMIVNGDLVY